MDYSRMTWKDLAELSIMTAEERAVVHNVPTSMRLFRQALEPYARPNSRGKYPALHSSIVEDMHMAQHTGRIEHAAFLKGCMQRRLLDGWQGKLLMDIGISDEEIMLHEDALARGLKPRNIGLWHKVWHELSVERPWPWDQPPADAVSAKPDHHPKTEFQATRPSASTIAAGQA